MGSLLREPLLHFLLLGALLFAAHGWLRGGAGDREDVIVVDAGRIASIEAQFERVWQRPPTAQERAGLIETFVREEVLYREGLELGLDRDDPVIRRRIGQKMEFVADGLVPQAPTHAELQAWLDAHPAEYVIAARVGFEQLYFDPQRRGAALDTDIARALSTLEEGASGTDAAMGDPTQLPSSLSEAFEPDVERVFGSRFAREVAQLPVGSWQGPVRSEYGLHLVRVIAREEARTPTLESVARQVERDLLHARTQQASEAFYQTLRARYTVRVADPAGPRPDLAATAEPRP
jgi:hypothetical protein